MENKTSLKVKCIRYDNKEQYRNRIFRDFCASNEIKIEKIVLRMPQQKIIIERMNITLNEHARRFGIQACLSKIFGVEAINVVTYLINYGPFVSLNKT